MYAVGNMTKQLATRKVALLQAQNGKIFQKTLNAHFAVLAKICSAKTNFRKLVPLNQNLSKSI